MESFGARKHKLGLCNADTCYFCKEEDIERKAGWDGKCHGCEQPIFEKYVAQIGPYWICNNCKATHFPNEKYSVNQAADILERVRGFK